MKDFINDLIDDLQTKEENNDDIPYVSKKDEQTKSIRQYWVEILLCLMCLCYLYYVSSSIYNYTFLGFSLGRLVSQALVFVLPFIGLWLFYRVNKTRKVESNIRNGNSMTKNLLIAMKQNGRCAKCTRILGNDYILEGAKKDLKAICSNCYDRKCLNNSLYKTLRDF